MSTITRRSVRRASPSAPGRRAVPTLNAVLADLQRQKIPSKLEGTRTHGPWGRRIVVLVTHFLRTRVLTFAHPTKKSTRGRLASLTI